MLPAFFLLTLTVRAQINSTAYSSQGLGNLSGSAFIQNAAMGGVGIATGNGLHINNINPALLYRNSLSSFDIAAASEFKNTSKEGESAHDVTGGLSYGAFAFPAIPNRWAIGIGLMPFSTVGYRISETIPVEGNNNNAQRMLEGDGGISQVYFSNGVRLYKNLAVGLRLGYLFGTISNDISILPLTTDDYSFRTSYREEVFYSGILPEAGLYYNQKIGKTSSVSAGIIYQPKTSIHGIRDVRFERSAINSPDIPLTQDTISNENGSAKLPQKLGFGLSVEKYLKYSIGVDITLQQWENFEAYTPDSISTSGTNDGLKNSLNVAIGGEIIPNASSVNSYLKRVAYRAGFIYQHTPFYVDGQQITDLGVTFGFSLPVSNLSSINMAFQTGKRGTLSDGLIKENYFQIKLGVSFNDRWFIRRKFD